jgi:Domain of unknown function (DUF4328)
VRCPRCGNGAGPGDRWCVTCGTVLPPPAPAADDRPPAPTWPDGSPADPRWHPLAERARWARAALVVAAVVWAAQVAADVVRLATLAAAEDGPTAEAADRVRNAGAWQDGLAVAGLLAAGAALVVGARWLDGAYRNLPALGARDLRTMPAWASWGWLVPGLNLVRPKSIVDDVWRGSTPSLPAVPGPAWRAAPVGAVVHAWWAAVVGAVVLGVVAAVIRAGDGTTPGELVAGARLEVASGAVGVVAWVLSIAVVRAVTGRQEERVAVLTGRAPASVGAGAVSGRAGRRPSRPGAPAAVGTVGAPARPSRRGRGAPWWPVPR